MAGPDRSSSESGLVERLEAVLPHRSTFKLYHISTPPARTDPIYPALPGSVPERTYCESHFLAVSVEVDAKEVLVYGIEIFIYTTAYSSTFFVSKADSTGYLTLLILPKGVSPVKAISSIFLEYLVEKRRRPNITSVISLFARAQDQYLFPGSIENKGKHVLDDRGLVRWWCKVLDPIAKQVGTTRAHLLVPGLDKYETLGLLPLDKASWIVGHPLRELFSEGLPPRCMIPHFPDDPKARFIDELDEETEGSEDGMWKSVKSLDQFWEMMAFRQECSAGRMVGFIWVVLKPDEVSGQDSGDSQQTTSTVDTELSEIFDREKQVDSAVFSSQIVPDDSHLQPLKTQPTKIKKKLTGVIHPRQPKIKTESRRFKRKIPGISPYYSWPAEGRGEVIVDEKEYKKITELLLHLDFEDFERAASSSRRWTEEIGRDWGQTLTGRKVVEVQAEKETGVATLSMSLMRKKRKVEEPPPVNVLSGMMIKKKAKP